MVSIFQYSRYFRYLRDLAEKDDFSVTELAKAAQVQRPYMSNVLGERAFLNSEQAFRVSRFLSHSQREQDYFLALIELEKASSGEYKNYLKKKIEGLKQEADKLINKLDRAEAPKTSEVAAEYYSSWEYVAIHILVSIPDYQKVTAIAEKLRLPLHFAEECLGKLLAWGLIKKERDRYSWASGNIHVPSNSPLVLLHHSNWRDKSIEDARFNRDEAVHFTSLYSISREDFAEIKDGILDMIKAYNKKAAVSKEEEAVCLNLDFFRLK